MSVFERYLTVWVFLCILTGIALGQLIPSVAQAVGRLEVAKVNIPVGVLIWVMIVPMLLRVDFAALSKVGSHWRGIGVTLFINWAVKPFTMAFLGWLFVRHVFAAYLPSDQLDKLRGGADPARRRALHGDGLRLEPADGRDPTFTLSQVALNDTIMVFAFAPIVGLLLGLSAITVPWDTLITSVMLYIVLPVLFAQVWRRQLLKSGQDAFERVLHRIGPWSIAALLLTLVLLFAFQGEAIIRQPLVIGMLAVPILIQVIFNAAWPTGSTARSARSTTSHAIGADRRIQLFRAGGGRCHQPVRLPLGRRPSNGRGRPRRGAGHARGREGREFVARLVRAPNFLSSTPHWNRATADGHREIAAMRACTASGRCHQSPFNLLMNRRMLGVLRPVSSMKFETARSSISTAACGGTPMSSPSS